MISRKKLIEKIRAEFDMQDLYLPVHFIELVESMPEIETEVYLPLATIQGCIEVRAETAEKFAKEGKGEKYRIMAEEARAIQSLMDTAAAVSNCAVHVYKRGGKA